MRRKAIIAIVLALLSGCDFRTAEDYLNEADRLYEEKKFKEAIVLLDKAIGKDPDYLGSYINRGVNKSAMGDTAGAMRDYKLVIDRDPKNTLALFNLGNICIRLKDFSTAIDYYNKAMATKGGEFISLDYEPGNLAGLGEYDVPGHEIRYARGIAWYRVDSLRRAYTDFHAAIGEHYMEPESYCWLGYVYVSSGQMELACKNFRESARLGDKDALIELKKYCN